MSSTPSGQSDDTTVAQACVYTVLAARLRCLVAREVATSAENIEDACAFAWLKFLELEPRAETRMAWLRTVAIREAWRLSRIERRTQSLEWTAEVAAAPPVGPAFADVVDVLRTLHPRRRELLVLRAAGFSTAELAAGAGISEERVRELIYRARLQAARRSGRSAQRR